MSFFPRDVGAPAAGPAIIWEEPACLLCGKRKAEPLVEAPDSTAGGTGFWFAAVQCQECGLCFTSRRNDRMTSEPGISSSKPDLGISVEDLCRLSVKQLTETLKRAEDVLADVQRMTKPFGEKSPVWFKSLDESSENLNRVLRDLRELIQVVARNDGTVQRLLSDPSLYNNLNDSALMTAKILPRLDRVMRDMEIFADKLARHPELLDR